MAFSEKLYTLRRKSGLSQEQLAEQLGVSRQAISKWESGQSVPESDKLIVISNYFKVSLDYLLKETDKHETIPEVSNANHVVHSSDKTKWLLGMICFIGGIVCLIIWGLFPVLSPDTSSHLSESSTIHIDGNGIFLILCIVATVVGAALLLKTTRKK